MWSETGRLASNYIHDIKLNPYRLVQPMSPPGYINNYQVLQGVLLRDWFGQLASVEQLYRQSTSALFV